MLTLRLDAFNYCVFRTRVYIEGTSRLCVTYNLPLDKSKKTSTIVNKTAIARRGFADENMRRPAKLQDKVDETSAYVGFISHLVATAGSSVIRTSDHVAQCTKLSSRIGLYMNRPRSLSGHVLTVAINGLQISSPVCYYWELAAGHKKLIKSCTSL
jgi:hypothetical protein